MPVELDQISIYKEAKALQRGQRLVKGRIFWDPFVALKEITIRSVRCSRVILLISERSCHTLQAKVVADVETFEEKKLKMQKAMGESLEVTGSDPTAEQRRQNLIA